MATNPPPSQDRYEGGRDDTPQRTEYTGERGSQAAAERNTPLHVDDPVISAATSPDGTSESGQSYNPGTVQTGGTMARAVIGLLVVLILVILFVVLFTMR